MTVRLFVEPDALRAGSIEIDGDDHHYLFRVLRLAVGDHVIAFDGAGRQATAHIESVTADRAVLVADTPIATPAPRPEVTVILPLLKGERMDWCMSKLVELGAARIIPVRTRRTVVQLDGARAHRRHTRYVDRVRDAARQCRSPVVPVVEEIDDLEAVLPRVSAELRLLAWEGEREASLRAALPAEAPISIALASGPEGGLDPAEVDAARAAGFTSFGLGSRILRAETAPLAVAAILGYVYPEQPLPI